MNYDPHQPDIDERLRWVPLPKGLIERLRTARVPVFAELDDAVRNVPAPSGLNERVKQAIANEIIDDRLRDVELPWGLQARLRVIPQMRSFKRLRRLAMAASLLFMLGGGYLSSLAILLDSLRPESRSKVAGLLVVDHGPVEIVTNPYEFATVDIVASEVVEPASKMQFVSYETAPPMLAALGEPLTTGPAGTLFRELSAGLRPEADIFILRIGPLGATVSSGDRLPEFDAVAPPQPAGIEPPLVSPRSMGFDRNFLITRDVFPPSFPAADRRLEEVHVPLVTTPSSFNLTRRLVSQRRLPDADDIRVEEFLAAFPYDYEPVQPGQIGIRTSAGPHVFGQPGAGLLQIGVVAGDVQRRTFAATHLTIALDLSSSMSQQSRWENVRNSISHLVDNLGPRDQLSLVAFNDDIVQTIEGATQADIGDVQQIIGSLIPRGGTNLPTGLQKSISLALAPCDQQPTHQCLVLITDEAQPFRRTDFEKVSKLTHLAGEQGLRFTVLDLSDADHQDSPLAELAAAGNGHHVRPETADDMRWRLYRELNGHSGMIAADTVLRVKFNPKAVYAYRVVGHEPSLLLGDKSTVVTRDLRAREQATALFEVWLLPNGEDDVAWAEIEWRQPDTGEIRKRQPQRISRLQFANSFAEMPPRLQTAAIIAETAEVLRRGYSFWLEPNRPFSPRPKEDGFDHVLQMLDEVNWQLADQYEFKSLVDLIRRMDGLRAEGIVVRE
jgi:Ca-activated chloride channel family protein